MKPDGAFSQHPQGSALHDDKDELCRETPNRRLSKMTSSYRVTCYRLNFPALQFLLKLFVLQQTMIPMYNLKPE